MAIYADLQLKLSRYNETQYTAELLHYPVGQDVEQDMIPGGARFEVSAVGLRDYEPDWDTYGEKLRDAFFRNAEGQPNKISEAFAKARSRSRGDNAILRVRLLIDADAAELTEVHWETILDPEDGSRLFTSPELAFSRYILSADERRIKSRPRGDLKALIVVASPADLSQYPAGNVPFRVSTEEPQEMLAPIDKAKELEIAESALGAIEKHRLIETGQATLAQILKKLGEGFDILYLMCHGALKERSPGVWEARLYLEGPDGNAELTSGAEFVRQIEKLPERPRLIVLASCKSAGTGVDGTAAERGGVAAAVGPQLAVVGIPAVLAMRGNISIDTSSQFMKEFFSQLASDGQIDRAMEAARREVAGRSDFWIPVLYLRLRSGLIWYVPGFNATEDASALAEQWDGICSAVESGEFVPIVGPELSEIAFGSAADTAAELAKKKRSPMAAWENEDLAKVAQFLQATNTRPTLQRFVKETWLWRTVRRFPEFRPEDFPDCDLRKALPEILKKILARNMEDAGSPYRILAGFKKATVFVTANSDPLLELALESRDKKPVRELSPWRDERRDDAKPAASTLPIEPSPDAPVVYYPYGHMDSEETWLLTEDDIVDYLIRTSKSDFPSLVRTKLTMSTLMFLGFPLGDWRFRILFRMIWNQGGAEKFKRNLHVAVQVNPDATSMSDAVRAKKYLEMYFKEAKIHIFWGTATDFLKELSIKLKLRRERILEELRAEGMQ